MVMNPFPANEMSLPIPFVMTKDPEFLRARMKAVNAEEQKLFPVKATCIYALLLRNLMNLWKQSMQHRMQFEMQFRHPLLLPAIFLT